MESEAGLYDFDLTRFLDANRYPLRSKTLPMTGSIRCHRITMPGCAISNRDGCGRMRAAGFVPTPRGFFRPVRTSPKPFLRWRANTIRTSRAYRRAIPDGGQWTDGGAGGGNLGLFQITPRDNTIEGVQLAGDWPPDDGPPPIPPKRPETTEGRMKFVRQAVRWLRVVGRLSPAADIFLGALDQAEELKRLTDMIKTADDPPAPLEELQARARMPPEAGYEDHHIVGQFAQNRLQFGSVRIDSAENTVRIPVVKHLDINGYYSRANIDYGGLSPRDYLRGRSWDEQMQEGLKILRDKGVLQ